MGDIALPLKEMQPEKEFFVGIDSDGCAFDSMEIKHKECFCPSFIEEFNLQAVSKYAREVHEFVNLYSKSRGCNRFLAVVRNMELLSKRPEVSARGIKVSGMKGLAQWIERESKLGNPALVAEVERNPDPDLQMALRYSLAVNKTIERMVHGVPPFPLVRESLQKVTEKADAIVVSQTPYDALKREWEEHEIHSFVRLIAGQEMGTKTEHITFAAGGKYPPEKILMIGDAPGDLKAARGNNALFYPINPGGEEHSWKRFHEEALDRFFAGTYAGEYEKALLAEFNACLPEIPALERRMTYYSEGSATSDLSAVDLEAGLRTALDAIGPRKKVLAVPPDFTRVHSQAGPLTEGIYRYYGDRLAGVLPAIGTHSPMPDTQLDAMFPSVPKSLFMEHNWRDEIVTLGRIEAERIEKLSEGKLNYDWPAQVNQTIAKGGHDLILSVGQVIPHEVIGMANYTKNILVGTGGSEGIGKSHWLGAVYGLERIVGRADSPVRTVLNEAAERFCSHLPIVYVLTVVEAVPEPGGSHARMVVRGLFIGDDSECYYEAAKLAREVNVNLLDRAPRKIIAYMDPAEYHSTWIANKAIYRSRMAIADGGELVVIAPGVREYGEDPELDRLIGHHGYFGTQRTLDAVEADPDLAASLGAAAHLIHGSSEGRFNITYAAGELSASQIRDVGFDPMSVDDAVSRYHVAELQDGWNILPGGEEVYYLPNPGLGLWALRDKFIN